MTRIDDIIKELMRLTNKLKKIVEDIWRHDYFEKDNILLGTIFWFFLSWNVFGSHPFIQMILPTQRLILSISTSVVLLACRLGVDKLKEIVKFGEKMNDEL